MLDAAAHDVVTGLAVFDTDPPLVLTHLPLGNPPPGWVNLHGHVHHKPPAGHPYINVCVEHTDYRPIALADLVTLAKHRVAGRLPVGNTTIEQIRRIKDGNASAQTGGSEIERSGPPGGSSPFAFSAAAAAGNRQMTNPLLILAGLRTYRVTERGRRQSPCWPGERCTGPGRRRRRCTSGGDCCWK